MSQSSPFLHLRISTWLLPLSILPVTAIAATLAHACGSYYDCSGWIPALGNVVAYERWERLVTLAAAIYSAELAVISWVVYAGTVPVLSFNLRKVQLGAGAIGCMLIPMLPALGDVNARAGVDLEILCTCAYWLVCSALLLWLIISVLALRRMEGNMEIRQKMIYRVVKSLLWALLVLAFAMLVQWKHSYTQESMRLFNEYGFSVSRYIAGAIVLCLPILICQFFPNAVLRVPVPKSKKRDEALNTSLTMELSDYSRF